MEDRSIDRWFWWTEHRSGHDATRRNNLLIKDGGSRELCKAGNPEAHVQKCVPVCVDEKWMDFVSSTSVSRRLAAERSFNFMCSSPMIKISSRATDEWE